MTAAGMTTGKRSVLNGANGRAIAIALSVLVILGLFIVPLPAQILDVLIVTNIAIALLLILQSLFGNSVVGFSAFPQILLLTTFYRLALNVSSTRLILLGGDQGMDAAGRVIESFGQIVVRGDFVVGAIIFAIIAIVNFVVIAKGSARVAEVSARFMLDALPGKQLAIDADMRAGNISKEVAAERRNLLTRESHFFGSMDGAMKFVQGDAVAGLVITAINAVGGIAIGVSRGLPFNDAINSFGVLTIGDGLVNIIPALLISVCAGIVVTQAAGEQESARSEIAVFRDPWTLVIASSMLFLVSFLPGFPLVPFFLVASAILGFVVFSRGMKFIRKRGSSSVDWNLTFAGTSPSGPTDSGAVVELISHDVGPAADVASLRLTVDPDELGFALGLESGESSDVINFLTQLKETTYRERGILLPPVSFALDDSLGKGGYTVSVREHVVRRGVVKMNRRCVISNEGIVSAFGLAVEDRGIHPKSQQAVVWVDRNDPGIEALQHLDIEIVEPHEFVLLEVYGAALETVEELFGLKEVRVLLEQTRQRHPGLVSEVVDSGIINPSEFTELLRRLVRETVNIRDLKLILEAISEFHSSHPEPENRQDWAIELHAFVRRTLRRAILSDMLSPGDNLRLFVLSQEAEEEFRSALPVWDYPSARPPLEPDFERTLRMNVRKVCSPAIERGAVPVVVLCSEDIRLAVQEFFYPSYRASSLVAYLGV